MARVEMPSDDRSHERNRVRPFFHRMLTEREQPGDEWERELESASRRAGRRRDADARRRARTDRPA